jgi:beta-glucosidase
VTYCHFTTPRWFADMGSWRDKSAPGLFGRFAERVTAHLGDLVPWACTLNEPNVFDLLKQIGVAPSGETGTDADAFAAIAGPGLEVMAEVHRRGVEAIKSGPGDTQVGWTLALIDFQADIGGEEQCRRAQQTSELDWLEVSREDDFVGVQTYTRQRFGPDGVVVAPVDDRPKTENGWEAYPEALEHTTRLASVSAGVPVIVTENGIATSDDDVRRAYTSDALAGVARCLSDSLDVRGYLHWSLLDNFEWMFGYRMHFGLIAVNRETFERTVKPSARWLGEIARANELP